MISLYRSERATETRTLCDPQAMAAIADCGVDLVSFHDLRRSESRSL